MLFRSAFRERFLHSEEGVKFAANEFATLRSQIGTQMELIAAQNPNIQAKVTSNEQSITVQSLARAFVSAWDCNFRNSLRGSELKALVYRGHPPTLPGYPLNPPKILKERCFDFDICPPSELCWRERRNLERMWTTTLLADDLCKWFMDVAVKDRDKA